jgi:NAD dependent epimerase/dehydratase family enzyme
VLGSGGNIELDRPDDVVGAIQHAIVTDALQGPTNAWLPALSPTRITKTLGKVLGRPTVIPLPAFAARLMFGEMAMSCCWRAAQPTKLLASGTIPLPELKMPYGTCSS